MGRGVDVGAHRFGGPAPSSRSIFRQAAEDATAALNSSTTSEAFVLSALERMGGAERTDIRAVIDALSSANADLPVTCSPGSCSHDSRAEWALRVIAGRGGRRATIPSRVSFASSRS